jgi:murein DD-endopeptidase MepM/ murein hydrolase activator NlpD
MWDAGNMISYRINGFSMLFFAVIFFLYVIMVPLTSVALSSKQRRIIDSGAYYYNSESDTTFGITPGSGSGCYTLNAVTVNDIQGLAQAINQFIDTNAPASSPLRGLGSSVVSGSVRTDINPFFIVTIAQKESAFGTAGVATNGSNNSFGRTATASQPNIQTNRLWYRYDSFPASLDGGGTKDDQPEYMNRMFLQRDLVSIEDVMNVYAPPSENDTELYIDQMRGRIDELIELAGDSISCGTGSGWIWPHGSSSGRITSCFGSRDAPKANASKNHRGVDMADGTGTPIYAAAAGEVTYSGNLGSAGLLVKIRHADAESEIHNAVRIY